MRRLVASLGALPWVGIGANFAVAQAPAPATIEACAAISAATERLACYDRFSGRASAAPPAATASPPATGSAAAATPRPETPATTPPPTPAAALPPPESFGLYQAEHPKAPTRPTLTAKVTDLGIRPNGHQSVTLEGGQLWELDSSDPLLAKGDSVTIKRALLGSFMLKTPTGRTYRAYRIQ